MSEGRNGVSEQAADILAALGGVANIIEIEPCTTRLRSEVHDTTVVDVKALRAAGAHGVMISGHVVQVVMGPNVDTIATDLEELL
ncbi:MAG TPA: PTS glucose/sucrose transporter subunit IIB [Cellulomonas sp.]|uniref:PTS glucose/sucrose transporter subunit IIB n=1 Tax=Cellulomonas sp. TaxID=40001 RepID=UPI002E2ECFB3|nr:PTS glucose/sucrose transporter subunit IIB [Cellulomonas sp.]HEX5331158.1 PTS glucose/sucrose transporter subunit IIB [Cellulomonas sp.]